MQVKNLFRYWTFQVFSPGTVLREKYEAFKRLLDHDRKAHEFLAELEDIYYSRRKCDFYAVTKNYELYAAEVSGMVEELLNMSPSNYWSLKDYFKKFDFYIRFMTALPEFDFSPPFTIDFSRAGDYSEAVAGKKAFSLSLLHRELKLPAPGGFVITTNAFHYYLEANDLRQAIGEKLAALDIKNYASCEQTSREIIRLILAAEVPEDISASIKDALEKFETGRKSESHPPRFALRSSAVKEDGELSFAGQYKTLLNIGKKDIQDGYKEVIAGKYSPRALFYRISHGILDHETPMAVLVLEMVDSKASGVIYTKSSGRQGGDKLLINSIWGQGEFLVDGTAPCDVIRVSREDPDSPADITIASKPKQLRLSSKKKTEIVDTGEGMAERLSIDENSIATLARWGLSLEKHFKEPQDIEWCQDEFNNLFVLQSRPLNTSRLKMESSPELSEDDHKKAGPGKEDLFIPPGKQICSEADSICPGIGTGTLYILEDLSGMDNVPTGSVLAIRYALPQLVTLVERVSAIIIETGSMASHFASIAREFNIPSIVNVQNGFQSLKHGSPVTVDAGSGIVYEGICRDIPESLKRQPSDEKDALFRNSAFIKQLEYVLSFAARLKLTDPGAKDFSPEGCRSLHDIIRFAHETAMKEMFLLGGRKGARKKGAKQLVSGIPMLFYVLDVGRGVADGTDRKDVLKPEDIASIPMKYVLKGLLNPGICWSETTHFDWEEYDKIVMAGGIISADDPGFGSYAIVAREYINVNFRFGYHFVILDCLSSPSQADNYIMFRFSGGGGTSEGRALRAGFIKGILTRLGFMVDIKSDLIDAQLKNCGPEDMKTTLEQLGLLLGATKIMDMYIKDNMDMNLMIDDFFNGKYDFRSVTEPAD